MTEAAVPEALYADIGEGLRIHYHEAGEGPPVVFVHGSGPGASGWSNFNTNFPYFAKRGFRALVPDSLGYGYSSKPEDEYTLDFLVDGLVEFCDALELEHVSLVGNSLGGAMCIRFATRHPDRVRKLVLMAPGGLEDRETYMRMEGIRTMMGSVYAPGGVTREALRDTLRLQVFDPEMLSETTLAERWAIAEDQPSYVLKSLRVDDLRKELGKIACPVFALWGWDDKFCPVSGAEKIVRLCTDARVLTLTHCGHWVMVERTELFNRWSADFLGAVPL